MPRPHRRPSAFGDSERERVRQSRAESRVRRDWRQSGVSFTASALQLSMLPSPDSIKCRCCCCIAPTTTTAAACKEQHLGHTLTISWFAMMHCTRNRLNNGPQPSESEKEKGKCKLRKLLSRQNNARRYSLSSSALDAAHLIENNLLGKYFQALSGCGIFYGI